MSDNCFESNAAEHETDERKALLDLVLALRKAEIQDFLKQKELAKYGTKQELRQRLQEALDEGVLQYEQLVDLLDSVAPWGKQHVFLYEGPLSDVQSWKDPDHVLDLLKQHGGEELFNAKLTLMLPAKLTLSSVKHSDGKLRVTAIQKREDAERAPGYDRDEEARNGDRIELRAYIYRPTRTLVVFEWDLNANLAMLQITQLQEEDEYEAVAGEFFEIVEPWLSNKLFSPVDLRPAIRSLHKGEENEQAEVRSHGVHYLTPRGRRISAQSPSFRDSVVGELFLDDAMDRIRRNGIGHLGNFYFLPEVESGSVANPLTNEVHVMVVGSKSRINFPTPNTEEVIRYVLHRLRSLSAKAPGSSESLHAA